MRCNMRKVLVLLLVATTAWASQQDYPSRVDTATTNAGKKWLFQKGSTVKISSLAKLDTVGTGRTDTVLFKAGRIAFGAPSSRSAANTTLEGIIDLGAGSAIWEDSTSGIGIGYNVYWTTNQGRAANTRGVAEIDLTGLAISLEISDTTAADAAFSVKSSMTLRNQRTTPMVIFSTAHTAAVGLVQPSGIGVQFSNAAPDNNSNYFFKGYDNSLTRVLIYSDGDLQNHDNSYGAISDSSAKQNIVDAPDVTDALDRIQIHEFEYKDDPGKKHIGVVAQEIQHDFPELVSQCVVERDSVTGVGGNLDTVTVRDSLLSVNYMGFVPKLIQRTQSLADSISTLQELVAGLAASVAALLVATAALKKQVNALEARIATLEGVDPSPPNKEEV